MAARLELPALHKELDGFKHRFDKWAQQTVSAAEQLRDGHLRRVRQLQAALRTLEQRRAELEQQAASVQQRLSTEHAEAEQLQAELSKIQAEQAALPALVQEVRESLQQEVEQYERQAASLSNTEFLKQRKLDALHKALAMYRQNLGLSFEHGEDGERMQVVLTLVDPRQHQRRFTFTVQVLEGNEYRVPACKPPVEALPRLLSELNTGALKFGQFVQRMRREFQAIVQAEVQQQQAAQV